jgi:linoleoyl-CoA desaturase
MPIQNRCRLRDKHIHSVEDSDLLRAICRKVDAGLIVDKSKFRLVIGLKFLFFVTFSASLYASLYYVDQAGAFVVCFVLYGFSILLFAFNFAHDFSHGTLFRKPTWDNIGFIFIYMLNGAHAEAWKKRHIESHHFAPNVEHYDSDLEISGLIRVIPQSRHCWFHQFQHLYAPLAYTTYSLYWVFIKDFYLFNQEKRKTIGYTLSFLLQKLCYLTYLVILPLVFSGQLWYFVLLGFVLMHLVQSLFLLFTFFMTHHVEGMEYPLVDEHGNIHSSWLMNQVKSSNDMYPFSAAANFVFGGFNNHIAHHLFPNIHHVYYPELSKILYEALNERGITPSQTTYWGGICSHLRFLKTMGRNVNMQGWEMRSGKPEYDKI